MLKDLSTLIRLHKFRVDEKRRALGELLAKVSILDKKNKSLVAEVASEQRTAGAAPASVGMFYGTYAIEAENKRNKLLTEISDVEKKIAEKKEEMRIEYKDLKVFEITQEAREQATELEMSKKEQATLDELGLEVYRRRT